jgi:selenocysteine lyase/cysteine desulfurase
MNQPEDKTGRDNNSTLSGLPNSRRDFLKLCGAATVGGVSAFLLSGEAEALSALEAIKSGTSKNIRDELFWKLVRKQFVLQPGLIYMNTGTEGSMPRCVLSRIQSYCREFAENPYAAVIDSEQFNYFQTATRTNVGAFVGADEAEIVITTNTTEGMAFIANGLDLQAGDEVLTTLHEHEAGIFPWYILRDRRNVTVTQVPLPSPATSKDQIISIFQNAITPQTKVMSFCHINYTTGLRMPVQELCQLAKDHGLISVVDGAHAIGMLNLSLHDLGCDFYACSPHKWLCAPPGTGVLYMRSDVQNLIWPTCTNLYPPTPGYYSDTFQFRGQLSTPFFNCINDVMELHTTIGEDRVQERILDLSAYLKEKISENWGADKIYSPSSTDRDLCSGLVSFNPFDDPYDASKTKTVLYGLKDNYQIIIRRVSFKDTASDTKSKSMLRVSTNIFNNYDEIDTLISSMKEIMAGM